MALQSPYTFLRESESDRKKTKSNFYLILTSFKVQEHHYLHIYIYRHFVEQIFKKGRGRGTNLVSFLISSTKLSILRPHCSDGTIKMDMSLKCGGI
jgi:hypothetical protein